MTLIPDTKPPQAAPDFHTSSGIRRMVYSAVAIGSVVFLVKGISFFKDVIVAAWMGPSDQLDIYLMALVVPSYLFNVFGATVQNAFLPTYIHQRDTLSPDAGQRLSRAILFWVLLISFLVTLLGLALAPFYLPHLAGGFAPAKLAQTLQLTYLLLFSLVIKGITQYSTSLLNAGERFVLATLAPVATPLCILPFLYFSIKQPGNLMLPATAMAWGTLVGALVEMLMLLWGLAKKHLLVSPQAWVWNPTVRTVATEYSHVMGGVLFMSATDLVGQAIASRLEPGSVSLLNYANKIPALIASVGVMALATAAFPQFSQMWARNNLAGIRRNLWFFSRLIFLASVPFLLVMYVLSEPLVRLLFERGQFDTTHTQMVAHLQFVYLLNVPLQFTGILFSRVLSAMNKNQVLFWLSVCSLVLNTVSSLVLSQRVGLQGIVWATVIMYAFSFSFMLVALIRAFKAKARELAHPTQPI